MALLLIFAFTFSGWQIVSRSPAVGFATVPRPVLPLAPMQDGASKVSIPSSMPSQRLLPDGRFRAEAQFVSSSPGQAVHAASIVELLDGRLRAVWFSGSREGASDVSIRTSVMDVKSQQWGDEHTLFDRNIVQQGLWRYVKKLGNPVIARAPDGSLWLWMVTVSLGGWAGSSITWARSVDEGASWSAPQRLVTSPFLNISTLVKGAPVFYQDGHIGLPVYHELATKFAEILQINPQGKVLDKTRIPGSQTNLQPVILVSSPQQAQVYMRSGQAISLMMSETDDGGQTWSPAHATSWANPDSALTGVVTTNGQQWLALNPGPRNREILAMLPARAGGFFEGATPWIVESSATPERRTSLGDYERLLSDELKSHGVSQAQTEAYVASARRQLCGADTCSQEFSYPYLLQSRDGYLHLVYTWHRTRIKHVRFDPLQFTPIPPAAPAAMRHVFATH